MGTGRQKPELLAVGRSVDAAVRRNFDALRAYFTNPAPTPYRDLVGRPDVSLLSMTVSNPPTQAEVQLIVAKLNSLLRAL